MPPGAARAIEVQVPIENSNADRTLCRILILPPTATAAEPHVDQMRAASSKHDGSANTGRGRLPLGPPADEEPTWEDAEWQ
jgi:hypothetical protein